MLLLFLPGHVPLDFNWILFIFGHISGTATGDGSRNATRHTMTNVDIQMTPLGAEDAGRAGRGKQARGNHLLDFCQSLARSHSHSQSRVPIRQRATPASGIPIDCWPCRWMPVVGSSRGWVRKVNRLSCSSCSCYSPPPPLNATGSRCLKCLRDFVNVSSFYPSFLLSFSN